MKRFWTDVAVVEDGTGYGLALDGKRVKTPARADLIVPGERLAREIAAEWDAQGDDIHPRSMPLTGLANGAVDRVAADPQSFITSLAAYGENDLLCYRAEGPDSLVERQSAAWDPLLAWARRRFDVDFTLVQGVMHKPQPTATIQRLAQAVAALDPFRLAGLSPLVTIGGSLVVAMAVLEGAITPEVGWAASTVDETWQAEKWGEDAEATAMLALRRTDYLAGARFLALLD